MGNTGEIPTRMKRQSVKQVRFAIIKLFFAILTIGIPTVSDNSIALAIRHYPVELLEENPLVHVQRVIDSGVPTAFTIDGIDSVVLLQADEYFQLTSQTTSISLSTELVVQK